ncbi:nitrogen fixation protein NifR [Staphylococcus aureus]|nr:nitrogen fixation protein NifR [Staphylococcus aureus]RNB45030.1 nitrogen fixation protein NifR [Staphylococcus aureus]
MQVGGPQHREFRKEILQVMQVGKDRNKFCENIIFVLLPLTFLFQSRDVKILREK